MDVGSQIFIITQALDAIARSLHWIEWCVTFVAFSAGTFFLKKAIFG